MGCEQNVLENLEKMPMVRQMLSALKVGNKDGEREEEIGGQRKRLRVTAIVNFVYDTLYSCSQVYITSKVTNNLLCSKVSFF